MSSNPTPPVAVFAFQQTSWKKMELKELRSQLFDAITEDPQIGNASNIAVNVHSGDSGADPIIELAGKVDTAQDKARAGQIVAVNTGDEAKVTNNLVVG